MSGRSVELRSDTFTRPSAAMREAIAQAEVGDDVWNEDPTVHRLEELAAELTGKAAAVLVTSGTQGNLIGILSHAQHGDEVIVGDESHLFRFEVAGTAVVGGLQLRALPTNERGLLEPEDVEAAIREEEIHEPRTGCVALENTHQRRGGRALSKDEMESVAAVARVRGIPLHLDGARVFNTAVALRVPADKLLAPVDSVTFCLSKGLGAPVGSVLCGSAAFIERARKWRKLLGGAMRQAGIIAAGGVFALENNIDRLSEDHANARALADGLANLPGIRVTPREIETNMVFFEVDPPHNAAGFAAALAQQGVRVSRMGERLRAVTSLEVSRDDILYAIDAASSVRTAAMPAIA
jgi:threonine aldolase